MKFNKLLLSSMLAVCLGGGLLVSCDDTPKPSSTVPSSDTSSSTSSSTNSSDSSSSTEETKITFADNIPEEDKEFIKKLNFEGHVIVSSHVAKDKIVAKYEVEGKNLYIYKGSDANTFSQTVSALFLIDSNATIVDVQVFTPYTNRPGDDNTGLVDNDFGLVGSDTGDVDFAAGTGATASGKKVVELSKLALAQAKEDLGLIKEFAVNDKGELTSYIAVDGVVTIPEKVGEVTVKTIPTTLFQDKTDFTKVVIPGTVTKVSEAAFMGSSVEEIVFSSSTSTSLTIGNYAFYDCTSLKSIAFERKLGTTTLKPLQFLHNDKLTSFTFAADETNYSYKDGLLTLNKSTATNIIYVAPTVESLEIGANVALATGGEWAFYKETLKAITVNTSNTNFKVIDNLLFAAQYGNFTKLIRPAAVAESYVIPSDTTYLYEGAFSFVSGEFSVTVNAENKEYKDNEGKYISDIDGADIYYVNKATTDTLVFPSSSSTVTFMKFSLNDKAKLQLDATNPTMIKKYKFHDFALYNVGEDFTITVKKGYLDDYKTYADKSFSDSLVNAVNYLVEAAE